MKITKYDLEIHCYSQTLSIERDGEVYTVNLSYDEQDGYTLRWRNSTGVVIDAPKWAKDIEEENGDPLGYILETMQEELANA